VSASRPEPARLEPWARRLLLTAFFLSGFAALVFEVVWTRLLLLNLGATAVAVAAVLGAFMGGMAIGSALAARPFLARRDPIALYALLEAGAGAYGLASPYLIELVADTPTVSRLILSLLALLPATAAMGASLPVLVRALGPGAPSAGATVGRLYAANTAGAVAGPLLAVFWLFPEFGLSSALHVASAVDIGIASLVALSGRALSAGLQLEPERTLAPETPSRPPMVLLLVLAVSGGTAMVYEVAWSRTLSLVFGSSVYGVSIMLASFLLGLAGGSALASCYLERRPERASVSACGFLLAGSAAGAVVSLFVAQSLPGLFLELYRAAPEDELALFGAQFLISGLLMLPATLALGALLPFATAALGSGKRDLGRKVSWLYTANLIGSTAGTLLAAALMLASLGLELSVRAAAVLALATALGIFFRRQFHFLGATAATTVLILLLAIDPTWDPVAKSFGLYNHLVAYARYGETELRNLLSSYELLYYKDGATATVSVQRVGQYTLLKINGKTDASNGSGDVETQLMLGHLPLLAAEAKRVAVIGWGSGMTVGAVLAYPVESVDAFEIEPSVVEASRFFEPINGRPLADPRVRLILGDARSELRREARSYDLIISEPSNPWLTGVANLFTREFFELAAARLRPDGILCQWFHLYGMSEESTRSLLATFRRVFPHALVFKDRDLILLGSRRPVSFDLARMRSL
jgi:spermidine synthase